MTAKEFLQRFLILQRTVDVTLDKIAKAQSTAQRITSVIKKTPTGGAQSLSCIENSVADIFELTDKLADVLAFALDVRTEIAEAISHVENHDERYLLELRYLCLDSWETIARRMNFSLQGVFKLHNRALKNFLTPQTV